MQYEQVHSFLIQKLENGLPSYLTYHNVGHTKNVVEAAEHLAIAEKVSGEDLVLLKTAALFHDTGYMQIYKGHEEVSCSLAKKYLPDFGYTPEQTATVCRLILATKWPVKPGDHLEMILCDADMYYLGTEHYAFYAEKLHQELKHNGTVKTKAEWLLQQLEFLTAHKFYTHTARTDREEQKQKELEHIRVELESSFSAARAIKPAELFQDILQMVFGVLFAGYALKGFLVPNHFFDGGITG
ncbi:MAG TPA: HD domain-containing protein, partial [Prolixibacteraceae bacterium]|nr:HD domain-containing protein [Prolixibacteraceae bacterium]